MSLKVGLVGATGMVGEVFIELLDELNFPLELLKPFASENSVGQAIHCQNQTWTVEALMPGCFSGLDVVFFSSGDEISKEWAPRAVSEGAYAIDNSAAFRSDANIPLVVPEINGALLDQLKQPSIVANPNCSTIQLIMALKPLLDQFGLQKVNVATYQAVSGAGKDALVEMQELIQLSEEQIKQAPTECFPHPIAYNALPHIGSFDDDGFCSEERKIMQETRKILAQPQLLVSAFTVRIPALNSHSEAVWVTLNSKATKEEVEQALSNFPGLELVRQDRPENYPTALQASDTNLVYVGRVHKDPNDEFTWMLWVVSDNLRKGAAYNGLQIAERIFDIRQKA